LNLAKKYFEIPLIIAEVNSLDSNITIYPNSASGWYQINVNVELMRGITISNLTVRVLKAENPLSVEFILDAEDILDGTYHH
jgi:hypothetical protein